ncbi:unnamed protein product [Brassica rapa subsp. narinosa]
MDHIFVTRARLPSPLMANSPKGLMKFKSSRLVLPKYLKYLTKKYLKKHNGMGWLRVIAANKDRNNLYELRDFKNEAEDED